MPLVRRSGDETRTSSSSRSVSVCSTGVVGTAVTDAEPFRSNAQTLMAFIVVTPRCRNSYSMPHDGTQELCLNLTDEGQRPKHDGRRINFDTGSKNSGRC